MQGSCIDVMERHVKIGPWRLLGGLRPLVPLPDWADGAASTFKVGLPRALGIVARSTTDT